MDHFVKYKERLHGNKKFNHLIKSILDFLDHYDVRFDAEYARVKE